ncbi:hypothetical protein [Virgibacillus salexigens]|uniref:hypothetical protein n=1 Tax=Virgibacillus salexigens TaxID=61016 RepID=UPI00190C7EC4|nr:hypothetical protein [Virgibacillus salexigens]
MLQQVTDPNPGFMGHALSALSALDGLGSFGAAFIIRIRSAFFLTFVKYPGGGSCWGWLSEWLLVTYPPSQSTIWATLQWIPKKVIAPDMISLFIHIMATIVSVIFM